MHMHDLFTQDRYTEAAEARLIKTREHPTEPLLIHNYTDAAMWTPGAWDNPAVRHCRGLITTRDGVVVARPWAKFFNHGQPEAGTLDLDAPVEVTDKIDGSLGIIYPTSHGPAVATRGSFTSEQAIHATKVLRERHPHFEPHPEVTALVEIVYPANRIVCDYGGLDDLVLIGGVNIETGAAIGLRLMNVVVEEEFLMAHTFEYATLREALAAPPRPGAEGFVVRYVDQPQRLVKIKQADYVQLHRLVTGLSERTVWQAIVDGKRRTDLLEGLPDELHPWVRDVWTRIVGDAVVKHQRAFYVHQDIVAELDPGFTRGEYAERATKHGGLAKWLFMLLDGRDPFPAIVRTLKPSGDARPRHHSEDVA